MIDIGLDDILTRPDGKRELARLMEEAWPFPIARYIESIPKDISIQRGNEIRTMVTPYLFLIDLAEAEPLVKILAKALKNSVGTIKDGIERIGRTMRKSETVRHINSDFLERLEEIRAAKSAAFDGKRKLKALADIIIEDMRSKGRFIFDGYRCWYQHKQTGCLYNIEIGTELRTFTSENYDVNASTEEYRFLAAELESEAKKCGLRVPVEKLAVYDPEIGRLYISNGENEVFKITKDGYQLLRSFDNNIFFSRLEKYQAFRFKENPVKDAPLEIIRKFSFGSNLTAEDVYFLFKYFFIYLLFYLTRAPIPFVLGEHGSAKSTLVKSVLKFFFGPDADVMADFDKANDLTATLANNVVFGWDNIEQLEERKINLLCTSSTGGVVSARKLYANNEVCEFKLKCAAILNGRTVQYFEKRPDLVDRLLIILVKPIEQKIPEEEIYTLIRNLRDDFWSETIISLPAILKNLEENRLRFKTINARMADFWLFVLRASGDENTVRRLIDNTRREQAKSSLEDCSWFTGLFAYINSKGPIVAKTAKEILMLLRAEGEYDSTSQLQKTSPEVFGRNLSQHIRNLQQFFTVKVIKKDHTNVYTLSLLDRGNGSQQGIENSHTPDAQQAEFKDESERAGSAGAPYQKEKDMNLDSNETVRIRDNTDVGVIIPEPPNWDAERTPGRAQLNLSTLAAPLAILSTLQQHPGLPELNASLIETRDDIEAWVAQRHKQLSFISVDIETTGLILGKDRICGIALADAESAIYLPLSHEQGRNIALVDVIEILAPIFGSEIPKIGFNLTFDIPMLRHEGFNVSPPFIDSRLLAREALFRVKRRYELKELARDLIHKSCDKWDVELADTLKREMKRTGKDSKALIYKLHPNQVFKYACADAVLARELAIYCWRSINERNS